MELRSTCLRVLAILVVAVVVVEAGKEEAFGGGGLDVMSGCALAFSSESEPELDEASSAVGLPGR